MSSDPDIELLRRQIAEGKPLVDQQNERVAQAKKGIGDVYATTLLLEPTSDLLQSSKSSWRRWKGVDLRNLCAHEHDQRGRICVTADDHSLAGRAIDREERASEVTNRSP